MALSSSSSLWRTKPLADEARFGHPARPRAKGGLQSGASRLRINVDKCLLASFRPQLDMIQGGLCKVSFGVCPKLQGPVFGVLVLSFGLR